MAVVVYGKLKFVPFARERREIAISQWRFASKRNAGGGDAPRKRSASLSSEESSVGEEMDFVSDSDMDVDFILGIASDDDESDGDDDDNESDALTSARVWQRVDTDNPPPAPPRFPFSSVPGILRKPSDENDILRWFHVFFDWQIIDLTVTETNQFVVAYFAAWSSTWKPVDRDEIMVFLTLIILQGIVGKPQVEMYRSTKEVL
ncbi:hypothetical protein HPB48_017693 [Haemaphysalis longicornis]|uniref:PiggyBac transposable element-derived protein domain-containing protein n=1 Tax=Haemaphysalis longicornis TaxID=44386 RepID=A0A9J6FX53_HAELO|nr:hypothetical protein HPB48_017693 [Haemaphysalis longicornis]